MKKGAVAAVDKTKEKRSTADDLLALVSQLGCSSPFTASDRESKKNETNQNGRPVSLLFT